MLEVTAEVGPLPEGHGNLIRRKNWFINNLRQKLFPLAEVDTVWCEDGETKWVRLAQFWHDRCVPNRHAKVDIAGGS